MNDELENKKKRILKISLIISGVLVIILFGYLGYRLYNNSLPNINFKNQAKKVSDNKVVNNLDGTKVSPDLANRHPLAIMVENHPDARPQSGLDKASIIYEAITEGGITRFMAIYGPNDGEKIGPVRSARTYFIDWLAEFSAYYAHVGGNLDALQKIQQDKILDLDEFGLGETVFWRVPAAGKAIEHTMYTSTSKLYQAAVAKKYPTTASFTPLKFGDVLAAGARPATQTVNINFSSPQYAVSWAYDPTTNTYKRSMAGKPHNDAVTGEQLNASNVIVQQVNRWSAPTAINEQGWAMQTTGSDKAIIFSQGKEIKGTWKKNDQNSRTIFYDETGKEIVFTPGKFWIEIVPPDVFPTVSVS